MNPIDPITYRRATWIVGAVLLTASVSGYFMGLRQTRNSQLPVRHSAFGEGGPTLNSQLPLAAPDAGSAKPATRYAEQNRLQDGPNAAWKTSLATLVQPVVDYSTLTNVTEADRAVALRERSGRRAFDGAPPVVPHPVPQDSAASCLACHGPGLVIKDKVASRMSHQPYASCTQCHVPAVGPRIPVVETALLAPLTENQFAGLQVPFPSPPRRGRGQGEGLANRAWPQAPPTVPHPTLMRDDCLSCHGPQGLFGLRTPHPDRRSCTQCHAPSAELDQRQFLPPIAGGPSSVPSPPWRGRGQGEGSASQPSPTPPLGVFASWRENGKGELATTASPAHAVSSDARPLLSPRPRGGGEGQGEGAASLVRP